MFKKTILLVPVIFWLLSCSKDNATTDPVFQLPPETQVGANTFGVTIRGKVYIPRDPTGFNVGVSGKGMIYAGSLTAPWTEIRIIDGASAVGFKMVIHFKNLISNTLAIYPLTNSNFQDGIDSIDENHIYFKIWDSSISNYAYYGSVVNLGQINITKRSDGIISGIFSGKFVRYDNPNDFITITDGRFDLNLNTLPNTVFP